ncbi:hypothetical protein AVEN_55407-1 [Araneus ventricosus]|uniref:WDR36/Utp21 C-terminal domain-containing protein n=1 Tax=Araneus ventricosus TaxID=182803 RepID=A0A4Y2T667_ARAVE|nr:hypothetical protein AVEN_55407-1 [Araneus ventricosus]
MQDYFTWRKNTIYSFHCITFLLSWTIVVLTIPSGLKCNRLPLNRVHLGQAYALEKRVITHRNKPKEPVRVPKNAPFFLPVVSGLKPMFLIEDSDNWKEKVSDPLS